MSMTALSGLGGDELILILALILVLLGARKLPELVAGFRQGLKEFRKATWEVADEISGPADPRQAEVPLGHPVLVALTFVLGAVCLVLVAYEFCK